MRDRGLEEAVRAVGGVSELARQIGISQPSVSNWTRIPAECVLVVEAATGVSRTILRPDLYAEPGTARVTVDDVAAARAQEYALLAAMLACAPSAEFLGRLAQLQGDVSPLGVAHATLARAAGETVAEQVEREYFDLFIGVGRGELLPYGSYYLTGFLYERPLARLRADLAPLGIERVEGNVEPEDHAATLCEILSGLLSARLPAPEGTDQRIFEKHLAPWMGRFFADLERAEAANLYRHVGAVGRLFIDIETQALTLPS